MKTKVAFLLLFPFWAYVGCNGQIKDKQLSLNSFEYNESRDSIKKPQVKIHVNKEYDKNGNIVRFDSSYSYVHTIPYSGFPDWQNDSLFKQFRQEFFMNSSDFPVFKGYSDSLFRDSFFNDDYFKKTFEQHKRMLRDMQRQMDYFWKEEYILPQPIPLSEERTI